MMMAILRLQVIMFLHLLGGAFGQPNSRSVLSTSSLSRVVVSWSTGNVFLADQDTVYLLPGDLSEITSNVSRTAGQTPEGMTLSKQEDKLIVCWASAVHVHQLYSCHILFTKVYFILKLCTLSVPIICELLVKLSVVQMRL